MSYTNQNFKEEQEPVKVKKKLISKSDINNEELNNVNNNNNNVRNRSHTLGEDYRPPILKISSHDGHNSTDDLSSALLFSRSPMISAELTYGKINLESSAIPPTPTIPVLSSSPIQPHSLPINIKSSTKSKDQSGSGSSSSIGGGFFGLFSGKSANSSPVLSPTPSNGFKSPNIMNLNNLSPSLFSQPIMEPLQKRVNEGFMNEYYEKDKDPKALEKEMDELKTWSTVEIPSDIALAKKELKFVIRRGIPDEKRVLVWKTILGFDKQRENVYTYSEAVYAAYGSDQIPKKIRNIPTFGGVLSPSDHYLTLDGIQSVKHILSLLALNFPEIEYCPIIPDLVHILLIFMSESSVYRMINILIEKSKDSFYKYLNTNNTFCTAFVLTFDTLIEAHIPKLYKHMVNNLGINSSKVFSEEWFSRLFVSYLPYPTVLRIFDIYLNEGYKVIYRVALALLMIHRKSLLKCNKESKFLETLKKLCEQLIDSDQLIKKAFGIHLKRNQLNNIDAKQSGMLKYVVEPSIPIYYKPKVLIPSEIIDDDSIYEVIWDWLPHRLRICDPRIVYNSSRDGFNMKHLFERCQSKYPLLVLSKTKEGNVFGFFTGEELKPKEKYWGSAETFLFTLKPHVFVYKPILIDIDSSIGKINSLYINIGNDFIKVGSSEYGETALYLDKEFNGSTHPTETFNNPYLNQTPTFQSVTLEAIIFE